MRNWIVCVAAVTTIGNAAAGDETVLQLPFGRPLDRDLAKCKFSGKPETDWCGADRAFRRSTQVANRSIALYRPDPGTERSVPAWVMAERSSVRFDSNGNVVQIIVWTDGPAKQDEVIESVSMRFGKPKISPVVKQNAFGASILVKEANWNTPSVSVFHHCPELRKCAVVFSWPKWEIEGLATQARTPKAP